MTGLFLFHLGNNFLFSGNSYATFSSENQQD